jgi:putative ABC transport system permease protein
MTTRPPRLAEWLLARLLDDASREAVSGDLEEEYRRRARRSVAGARLWYCSHAVRSVISCRLTSQRRLAMRRMDFEAGSGATLRDLLRPAFRQFKDQPLYTLACAGTLALAVAAASTSLAVVKRAFLDPLPYARDESLVSVLTLTEGSTSAVSAHILREMRDANGPLSDYAPIRPASAAYSGADSTENVLSNLVTTDYFTMLGVQPSLGRLWSDGERDAVVVSRAFWQRALGSDANAVGQSITIDGTPRTITGVLADNFVPPYWATADLWMPLDVSVLLADPARGRRTLTVLARRAEGASQADVDAFLSLFSTQTQQQHPALHGRQQWVAVPLRQELVGAARPALIGTAAAAALLMLIVCANIAGLSTAHAVSSRHQMAVRAALGASRGRLLVEQLVDSLVVAAIGTVAGLWLAHALVSVVAQYQRQFLERLAPVALDATTVVAGLVAGLATGVIAAVIPRGVVSASRPADALRSARGSTADARLTTARSTLVIVQVALALVLIVGAGLLMRTVAHLTNVSLGFDTDRLTTFSVNLPGARYRSEASQIQFERDVLERLRRIHGVTSASASVGVPVLGGMGAALVIQGRPRENGIDEIAYFSVSPEFMSSMGARIVAGRDLLASDEENAPPVVLINEHMARKFWPDGNALGAQVQIGPGSPTQAWITVVGIVADVRQHGPTEDVRPTSFGSTRQYSWPRRNFTVRSNGASAVPLAMELRGAVRAVDPAVAIGMLAPIDQMIADRTARHTLVMLALTLFGTVALVLCVSGLYAVVALTSRTRRREYAIRLALGSARGRVRWLVVRQALVLGGGGAAVGLAAAAASTRAVEGLLHGVAPLDPLTFAVSAVALMVFAALAAWLPARQAERVDPVEALKAE